MINVSTSEFVIDLGDDFEFEKLVSDDKVVAEPSKVEEDVRQPGEKVQEVKKPSDATSFSPLEEVDEPQSEDEDESQFSIVPLAKEWFRTEGWTWKDEYLPEDSLKGFTQLLKNIIKYNSKPVYAFEEAKRFDEYLSNGGDPYKYLSEVYSQERGSALKLTPENPKHQRKILEAFFKETTKFEQDEIEQYLEMLEATGKMESEAVKAHAKLKTIAEKKAKELEEQQKALKEKQDRELDAYIETIKTTIQKLDYVAGYELTKEDKAKFTDYVLKVDKDGKTAYEKDLGSNLEVGLKVAFMMYKKMYDVKIDEKLKSKATKEIFESLGNLGKKKTPPKNYNIQESFFNSLQEL